MLEKRGMKSPGLDAGEVWVLTYAPFGEKMRTRPFGVDGFGRLRDTSGVRLNLEDVEVTAYKRIWPVEN